MMFINRAPTLIEETALRSSKLLRLGAPLTHAQLLLHAI